MKEAVEAGMLEALASHMPVPTGAGTANADATLVVRIESLVRGKYAVIYAKPTSVTALMQWSRNGVITDEARIKVDVAASPIHPAIVQRARIAGDEAGQIATRYFNELSR